VNNAQYWSLIAPYQIASPRLAPYAQIFQGNVDTVNNCYGNCPNGDNPDTGFTKADLDALINYSIGNGLLPPPQANDNSIYVVFVPTFGSTNKAGCGDCNYTIQANSDGVHFDSGANYNGTPYTVVFGVGDYDGMSHELVEAIASYEGINTTDTSCGGGGGTQIADMCGCGEETVNTFQIASYFSTYLRQCVVPESWGSLLRDANGSWNLTSGGFPLRQAYGGAGGVVATDTTEATDGSGNAVYFYNGSTWSRIGGGGSQFAAGGGIVAGIALDPVNGIFYRSTNLSSGWVQIFTPPGSSVVTGVTVTSNGVIVATDNFARPWYYDPSNPGWQLLINAQFDQIIAGQGTVWALYPSHNAVYSWNGPGNSMNFYASVSPTTQIVANPDSPGLALSVAGAAVFTYGANMFSNTLQASVNIDDSGNAVFEWLNSANAGVFRFTGGSSFVTTSGGWLISGSAPYVTAWGNYVGNTQTGGFGYVAGAGLTSETPLAQPQFCSSGSPCP
jgi:hypothetical protein